METKKCISCKKEKPLVNYNNNKFNKDGKSSLCKNCRNKYYKNRGIPAITLNDIPDMKKCIMCKENHLLVNYHNSKYGKDGKVRICKYCCKEKIKKYRVKRIPDVNDIDEQILNDIERIDIKKNKYSGDIPDEEFNPLQESMKDKKEINFLKERNLFVEQQHYINQRLITLKNEYKIIDSIGFFDSSFEKTQRDKDRLLEIKSQLIILEELLICVKPNTKQHNK